MYTYQFALCKIRYQIAVLRAIEMVQEPEREIPFERDTDDDDDDDKDGARTHATTNQVVFTHWCQIERARAKLSWHFCLCFRT